jgi:hypothetical protein
LLIIIRTPSAGRLTRKYVDWDLLEMTLSK